MIERGHILVEIFDRVIVDGVALEESVCLHARGEAEELADLLHGQAAISICAGCGFFEKQASGVSSGRYKLRGKLIGNFHGHLHELSVAKEVGKVMRAI